MSTKILWTVAVVALVVATIAFGLASNKGTSSGTTVQVDQQWLPNGLKVGKTGQTIIDTIGTIFSPISVLSGGVLATTTPASMTLSKSDLLYSTITMNPTVGAVTITLPATTTLTTWLPKTGDRTSLMIVNGTSTDVSITVAGGTGTLLKNASTSAAIVSGSAGLLQFVRKLNGDIDALFITGA